VTVSVGGARDAVNLHCRLVSDPRLSEVTSGYLARPCPSACPPTRWRSRRRSNRGDRDLRGLRQRIEGPLRGSRLLCTGQATPPMTRSGRSTTVLTPDPDSATTGARLVCHRAPSEHRHAVDARRGRHPRSVWPVGHLTFSDPRGRAPVQRVRRERSARASVRCRPRRPRRRRGLTGTSSPKRDTLSPLATLSPSITHTPDKHNPKSHNPT